MRVEAYVQARYGRLLEYAVELGAPEGQAAEYVDEVLLANRRRIRRARDPDPLVRTELARAISGRRPHSREWIAIAVVVGLAVVVGFSALIFRPQRQSVPSLFGYDAAQASSALQSVGLNAVPRPVRACEPQDLVLGTSPAAGTLLRAGSSVDVRTAVPSSDCLATYAQRSAAWSFVAFARGLAPAPTLADQVRIYVDGALVRTLGNDEARDRRAWGRALSLIQEAADAPAPTRSGLPSLDVDQTTPPAMWCGITRPDGLQQRQVLRLRIDDTPDARAADCPLTVDLYRSGPTTDGAGQLDTLVVYTAADSSTLDDTDQGG